MRLEHRNLLGYALALAGAGAAVIVAALAQRAFGLDDLSPVFMLAVLAVAARSSTGPAVVTAVLCFLGYNFFFIEPRYTFYISAGPGVATILLFLAAALLAGRLAAHLAMQVHALRRSNQQALMRQELGQRLATAANEEDVLHAALDFFHRNLDAGVLVQIREHAADAGNATTRPTRPFDPTGLPRIESAEESGWLALPLGTPHACLGVIRLPRGAIDSDEGQRQVILSMVDDVAQALLRTRLVADLQSARVANETEQLRNALLSSVSHDLRTPLAGMLGAAESLKTYGKNLGDTDRDGLLDTVLEEGLRLDRYIQNLLDMTRLGHGELAINRDWIGVDELVGSAIGRLQRYRPGTRFTVTIAGDIGPVWVHPALMEQALFNVIENAAKFSPAGEPIRIDARRVADSICIDISDRGPGIPESERRHIFEKFYSIERNDPARSGTGLGLAICSGMVGAHGGTVEALGVESGSGTTIRITLPLQIPDSGGDDA
ncbi:MAG: ATP-binding protein [Rhodanobacteraceae bacterium]